MFAHVKRGFRESEVFVICAAAEPAQRVPFAVRECTVYRDKTRPSFYEMEKIALIITIRDAKRTGFAPATEAATTDGEIKLILDKNA